MSLSVLATVLWQTEPSIILQAGLDDIITTAAANKHLETKKKKLLMCDVMSTFVCALSRKKQTIIYKTPCGGSGVFFQPEITSSATNMFMHE